MIEAQRDRSTAKRAQTSGRSLPRVRCVLAAEVSPSFEDLSKSSLMNGVRVAIEPGGVLAEEVDIFVPVSRTIPQPAAGAPPAEHSGTGSVRKHRPRIRRAATCTLVEGPGGGPFLGLARGIALLACLRAAAARLCSL